MNSPQTWAEALNINAEKLSEWSLQAPPSIPVLVWCLENGHVSIEDYLAWACEHYGLPILNTAFFTQSFDRSFITEDMRTGEFWSAWCFPIGLWEDVTLVACVEPPTHRPEGNYAFILADAAAMHEIWGRKESSDVAAIEAPAGINLAATSTFVLNLDNLDLNLGGEVSGEDPHQMNEEKTALSLAMDISALNADDEVVEVAEPTPPPAAKSRSSSSPPPLKAVPSGTQSSAAIPKPSPAKILANDDAEVQAAFIQLSKEFQSALIMKCSNGVAIPYKWDAKLKIAAGDKSTHINLSAPSFFRIVMKTSHPYHGYVVESPVHSAYFEGLRLSEAPASVTCIPLFSTGNKLWGFMVAFGDESAQGPLSLEHAMKVCEKLTSVCAATWGQAAA